MKKLLSLVFLLFLFISATSPDERVTQWTYQISQPQAQVGDEVELVFTAKIDKDWYLYSSDFNPDLGPVVTNFNFEDNGTFELVGTIQPVAPKKKYDRTWDGEVTYFVKKGEFRQKIKVLKSHFEVGGTIHGQVCSENKGECLPFTETFRFESRE